MTSNIIARNDICICIAVLEHVPNPQEVLRKIVDSCKYLVLKVDPTNPNNAHPMHFEEHFKWLHKIDGLDKEALKEYGLERINETDPVIFSTKRGRSED